MKHVLSSNYPPAANGNFPKIIPTVLDSGSIVTSVPGKAGQKLVNGAQSTATVLGNGFKDINSQ